MNSKMIIKVKLQDGAPAHYNFQISEAATFAALHEECVRHANEFCSGYTVENTKLELGGTLERYRAVLPTDELVLKLVDPKKMKASVYFKDAADEPIMAPHNDAGISYSPPRSRLRSVSFEIIDDVFVRWVTVTRALDFKKLSDIPYDTALERSAPLPELKKRALDWLKSHENSSSLPIECYLTHCYLPVPEQKHMTLAELGLKGSRREPLNIFVVPRNLKIRARDAKTTLNTLKRWDRQPEKLGGMPEVLLKVTHFPPFLLALEELQDSEGAISSHSQSNLLAQGVVIDCLVELAIRIMLDLSSKESPRTAAIAHLPNVIDWLLSKSLSNAQPIVRPVRLQYMDRTRDQNATNNNHKAFKHVEVVKLPASIGAPPDRDIVEVSLESTNGIQPALLARALYPCYSDTFNYFLEDTPQTRALLEEDRALPSLSYSTGQEHAENQGANERQPEFTSGKGEMKESISPKDRASSKALWQEQQGTFDDDRGNEELQKLRDKVRQLEQALEESNVEAGTYRMNKENLQVKCASLKRKNGELKEKLREQEETLQDVLRGNDYSAGHI